jgi:hypothetical protein
MIPSSVNFPEVRPSAPCPHPGQTRNRLRVSRRFSLEDDEQAQVLVRREAMLCARLDEDGAAFLHRHLRTLDIEDAGPSSTT